MNAATDFSKIAPAYENRAVVQRAAANELMVLCAVDPHDDLLDVGCGSGQLTARLRAATGGRVTGIDPSPGMIEEARERYGHLNITFEVMAVERMPYQDEFNAIFCNSAYQWFTPPGPALAACLRALRQGGRMAVQSPARHDFCPNFLAAVQRVAEDPRTAETFAGFMSPWNMMETADDYRKVFQEAGFRVRHARIDRVASAHTVEEACGVFASGASAGYLNPDCYRTPFPEGYADTFRALLAEELARQADADGRVILVFHRLYLLAEKP